MCLCFEFRPSVVFLHHNSASTAFQYVVFVSFPSVSFPCISSFCIMNLHSIPFSLLFVTEQLSSLSILCLPSSTFIHGRPHDFFFVLLLSSCHVINSSSIRIKLNLARLCQTHHCLGSLSCRHQFGTAISQATSNLNNCLQYPSDLVVDRLGNL